MPIIPLKCPACGFEFEVLTTIAHSTKCEKCGAEGERVWALGTLIVSMHDSKNMTEGEIELAFDHKRDIERGVAAGEYEVTVKGPAEFRPEIPKRLY